MPALLASPSLEDDVRAVGSIAAMDDILRVVCRATGIGPAAGNGHLEPGMLVLTRRFATHALASRIKDLVGR